MGWFTGLRNIGAKYGITVSFSSRPVLTDSLARSLTYSLTNLLTRSYTCSLTKLVNRESLRPMTPGLRRHLAVSGETDC